MPFNLSAGESENTPIKQEHFRTILRVHLRVVEKILQKHDWAYPRYLYFDLNAGPGTDSAGAAGSPLIFIEEATRLGIPFEAFFFEQDAESMAALETAVADTTQSLGGLTGPCHYIAGDHNQTVHDAIARCISHRNAYGLAYGDPNNQDMPVSPLYRLASTPALRRLDVAVHVSATSYKRIRGARGGEDSAFLSSDLRNIGKRYTFIREPIATWQWTFALLTDWDAFPSFKKIGFHPADSQTGREIERRLNLSRKEFDAEVNTPLPFAWSDSQSIGTTASTSVTPNFSPSGASCLSAPVGAVNGAA